MIFELVVWAHHRETTHRSLLPARIVWKWMDNWMAVCQIMIGWKRMDNWMAMHQVMIGWKWMPDPTSHRCR